MIFYAPCYNEFNLDEPFPNHSTNTIERNRIVFEGVISIIDRILFPITEIDELLAAFNEAAWASIKSIMSSGPTHSPTPPLAIPRSQPHRRYGSRPSYPSFVTGTAEASMVLYMANAPYSTYTNYSWT